MFRGVRKKVEEKYEEMKIPCPICGKDAYFRSIVRKIPYYGEIRLVSVVCPNCGYRYTDVFVLKENQPKEVRLKLKDEKDLHAMLVLSSRASVEIPELGLSITPGPAAKGRMLPVSGLLMEFIDATKLAMKDATEEEKQRGKEIIEKLEKELEKPSGELTLIVRDPMGRSDIIPEEVRSKRAEEERKRVFL